MSIFQKARGTLR